MTETVKPNSATSAISSATTVRKKWNSQQATALLCKSKLPSYKRCSIPPIPNGCQTRSVLPHRNSANHLRVATQSYEQEPTLKSPKEKEMQAEIANLKKEIAVLKTENSVLKVKVRRVDDESNQKTRQLEKLRAELRSVANSTAGSSKSRKDSESLLLLRQKCLRLEGALKEKELALKNLKNETKSMKMDELKGLVESYHKEMANCDGPGSNSNEPKSHKVLNSLCNEKLPSSKQSTKSTVRDQASKTEVTRLRDMFHKVQEENRVLLQHGKEKDQEIFRLKLQLQKMLSKPSGGARPAVTSSGSSRPLIRARSESTKRLTESSSSLVRERRRSSTQSASSQPAKPSRSGPVLQKRNFTKESLAPISSKTVSTGSTFVVTKVNGELKSKGTVKKSQQKPIVVCHQATEPDIESRVKDMRENIAARKIQRSWREHCKKLPGSEELTVEEEQAVSYIQSVLQDYRSRIEKLKKIASQEDKILQLQDDEERSIVLEVQATAKKLWS